MQRYFILSLIFCLLSDFSFAQTQSEMNLEAAEGFKKSDKQLDSVYKRILKEYKSDTLFIKNLRKSQRLWIQFRDAGQYFLSLIRE